MVYTGGRNGLARSAYFHAIVEQNFENGLDKEKEMWYSLAMKTNICFLGRWKR